MDPHVRKAHLRLCGKPLYDEWMEYVRMAARGRQVKADGRKMHASAGQQLMVVEAQKRAVELIAQGEKLIGKAGAFWGTAVFNELKNTGGDKRNHNAYGFSWIDGGCELADGTTYMEEGEPEL